MVYTKISSFSKIMLMAAAACLCISLFVPVWSIYLDAPQYPEGLSLQIWANKIDGDVDVINGLNHYIGMKTLHTEDFIEFTVLPYILPGFALLFLIVAFIGKRKGLYTALAAFVLFGVVAMIDFWKWEYDYGHNLDPNAAIKVPGMAYQPPLIGFKQLLNFGAYSIPDVGGWLFVVAGVLLAAAVFIEVRKVRKINIHTPVAVFLIVSFSLTSCDSNEPEPIAYNRDACEFCKMSISESRFASELITSKGRVYKFDDLSCMFRYMKEHGDVKIKNYYVGDFLRENILMDATGSFFVKHESFRSPMGGNIAAFAAKKAAVEYAVQNQTDVMAWRDLPHTVMEETYHEHAH